MLEFIHHLPPHLFAVSCLVSRSRDGRSQNKGRGVSGTVQISQIYFHISNFLSQVKSEDLKSGDSTASSKLELLGYNTGYRFIERLARDYPKFKDELDLLKFICKDFWVAVFRKQIDNLRTNHQGVYVLQDNSFKFLSKTSEDRQYLEASPKFVAFTCGLVRGSLANLGVKTVVTAEVTNMPACKFQVQVQRS